MGSAAALLFTIIFYLVRRVLTFQDCMNAFPEGFKAMISPVLILTFAWTLSNMTSFIGCERVCQRDFCGKCQSYDGDASGYRVLSSDLPGIFHGNFLGNLRYSASDHSRNQPAVGAIGDHRIRLSGRSWSAAIICSPDFLVPRLSSAGAAV